MKIRQKHLIPSFQTRAELGNVNEQDRTVEVVWSTGSKGLRSGWDGQYFEELSMDPKHVDMSRLNLGTAPVLSAHNQFDLESVIGVVERAWLENNQGKAVLRFSESDPVADKTFKKIQERILRNVSVGYSVQEYTDVSQKGDKVPTYRATRWQPQEISIVPIGFDMNAVTRNNETQNEVEIIEPSSEPNKEETMKFDKRILDEAGDKEAGAAAVAAQPDVDALTREAADKAAKEAVSSERKRVQDITQATRAAQLEDAFTQDLIERGVSVADASKEIFKKLEEQSAATAVRGTVSVQITQDENKTRAEGFENLLLHRVNPKQHQLSENARRFYGMSLLRMCEEILGGRLGMSDIQLANRAMTTSDLPNILANVAEKSMRQEFQVQPQSFKEWTKQGLLRNYKTANRLMLGDFPSLEKVTEHGEVKHGSVSESKETIQLDRYLKAISFTKEMLINDDLNALSDFSTKAARAAARLEASLVYTSTLLANPTMGDGNALFSTAHGNYDSTGADISVASLAAAWQAMTTQLTLDGLDYVDITPAYLICGPAKYLKAAQFMSESLLANVSTSINPFAGRLKVITDPRITGNKWFLAADPSQIDTIELARLEGEDGPMVTVEKGKIPGSILITCEHSAGAAVLDYRGLYYNVGA